MYYAIKAHMKKEVTKTQIFAIFAVVLVIVSGVVTYSYYASVRMNALEGTYGAVNHYMAGMPQSFYIDHYVKPAIQAQQK